MTNMIERFFMQVILVALALMPMLLAEAVTIREVRRIAARNNVTCILVFGDSSVDPGNNNVLSTTMKGNFLPYGRDFFGGQPTGRFSNGRLAPDFIAEALGHTNIVPAYLNTKLKMKDKIHGVSFASAGSGYDDLTANISNVLPFSRQVKYFRQYKAGLSKLVGASKADNIVKNAIFLLSMGTNDFLQNYYIEPIRFKQFSVKQYQNFLTSHVSRQIETLHRLGAKRMVIVGVPPMGCMPLVKTLMGSTSCVKSYNDVSFSFNSKIQQTLKTLKTTLGMNFGFVDTYAIVLNAIKYPKNYGLEETSKGCCGTGEIEYGDTCKGLQTCADRTKYVFWDAVHPTERMYRVIADEAVNSLAKKMLE